MRNDKFKEARVILQVICFFTSVNEAHHQINHPLHPPHLQFMVGERHDPVGHLILPNIFLVGQNVLRVFRSVGQFWIFRGHCPLS